MFSFLLSNIKLFKWVCFSFLLYPISLHAIDTFNLSVETISAHNWVLSNANIQLSKLNSTSPQLTLQAKNLQPPKDLNGIQLLNIECKQFHWQANKLNCQQGTASLTTELFKKQTFNFSFQVKNKQAQLKLNNLHLFGGTISLLATEKSGYWQADIHAKNISAQEINNFLALNKIESIAGNIKTEISLKGNMSGLEKAIINSLITQLSIQDKQGKFATENVSLQSSFTLIKQSKKWHWKTTKKLKSGDLYIEPVYLEIDKKQEISLLAAGDINTHTQIVDIKSAVLTHPKTATIHAKGNLSYQQNLSINNATINAHFIQLEKVSPLYISPFIEGTELKGFSLEGNLLANLTIKNNTLYNFESTLNSISINDTKQRFYAHNLEGSVYWNPNTVQQKTSSINWNSLIVKKIPFDAGIIKFSISDQHLTILGSPNLTLLDGTLNIEQFEFKKTVTDHSIIQLRAQINHLALDKLSMALGWKNTLSGTISGYIPSVTYKNNTLTLDGSLNMQLFDGELNITKLASSGLFTDFSRFYIDIDFNNLDLTQVTKKFKVGKIQGRLSGFAHNVYLENWQAVSFFAWLGTPENDKSNHLISHKAVQNIASLGGSNAADAISRGVLSWFDDFNYQHLGIGCYLNNGVCQLMGASAAKEGYYLVKGKGIPRIDIIGFNTSVDWNTLLSRLKRINSPDHITLDPID